MSRIPATERRAALARAALAVIARDGLGGGDHPRDRGRGRDAAGELPLRGPVARRAAPRTWWSWWSPRRGTRHSLRCWRGRAASGEASRLALTAYLELVKRDPGREQAMFELTQYALRTPALDDLPAEQYARYHALAIELLDAATAQHHPDLGECPCPTSPAFW